MQYCTIPWEEGTPSKSLYGEAPPENGTTFFRLEVYERVQIVLVEVFEGSENVKSSFVIYSYLKDKAF